MIENLKLYTVGGSIIEFDISKTMTGTKYFGIEVDSEVDSFDTNIIRELNIEEAIRLRDWLIEALKDEC